VAKIEDSADKKSNELKELKDNLKLALSRINEEFEDHLDSINENTNEIQANYEYLCEIDNKIEKLSEKLEEIQLILSKMTGKKLEMQSSSSYVKPLTRAEQQIFLVLYTSEKPISYMEMSKKLNISLTLIREHITNLIEKGVQIDKSYVKGRPHVILDKKFKDLQAKKNLVRLDQQRL